MTLSEKILDLRTRRGMSQEDLAAALEVSRQSVSKWETGQSTPDLDKIIRLADLFGVSVDELVREEERPEPPEPQVVYVSRRAGLTGVQKFGVCLEALGAILLLLGVAALGAVAAVIGAALMLLALPLLLAKKHPWLILGWLAVGLSLLVFNPYTSVSPWGLIGGAAAALLLSYQPRAALRHRPVQRRRRHRPGPYGPAGALWHLAGVAEGAKG